MDEFLYPVRIPKKREGEKGLVGHIEDQAVDVAVGVKEPKAAEVGRVKEMSHDEDELRKNTGKDNMGRKEERDIS